MLFTKIRNRISLRRRIKRRKTSYVSAVDQRNEP